MRAAEQKYGEELVVLFVDQQEGLPEVQAFAARYGLVSPFLMDNTGAIGNTYRLFSTPTTYFVNSQGVIQNIQPGVIDLNWIDKNMRTNS